jgi:alpha-tubulin suppressor-like RCC1 family protein
MPFGHHTLLLSEEGGLWAFGCNSSGQLGLGHKNHQWQPVQVPWSGPKPVQVDWGIQHSLVLDAEGGVRETSHSQDSPSTHLFQHVPGLPLITHVAAGASHNAALDTEGGLWVWASKDHLSWARSLPQRVEGLPPLLKVACGCDFLVAEAEEGLWVLGDNSFGQLGLGHTNNTPQPIVVHVEERSEGPLRCLAALGMGVIIVDSQGGVFSAGRNYQGQLGRSGDDSRLLQISDIPPMLTVSCGWYHALSLDENGRVWSWGCSEHGQLGTGNTSNRLPALVSSLEGMGALVGGGYHSLAFPQGGGLLVFGWNKFGQLGLTHTNNQTTPTPSPLQPALPSSASSRKKSARFL